MELVSLLGYVAYVLIVLFSPIQLLRMVRGKNLNLGAWPLASLTLGLALLQLSFFFVPGGVPAYLFFGNGASFIFTAINLVHVLRPFGRKSGLPARTAQNTDF